MKREQVAFVAGRTRTGIDPDVRAISTLLTVLCIVTMRCEAILEDENQFVTAAIEASHAGMVLGPHAHVFELSVNGPPRGKQLTDVPPVNKDVMERAFVAVAGEQRA